MSTKHNNHVHGVFNRNSPVSTKHNNHVHGVFTGTVQCLQNTTDHVHGVFTGTVRCLQNTTIMSMVCLQEHVQCLQNTTGTCPWCVYRNSPVSTKHNNHVHGVFTGTVQCLQNTTDHVHGVFTGTVVSTKHNRHVHGVSTGTVQCLQNTTDMSMVCLQEQSSVYKTQQSCPWCVYRNSPVSTKHNRSCPWCVYRNRPVSTKHNRSCPWCVYRNRPMSTKHNNHVHGVFTGTWPVSTKHNNHVHGVFTGTGQCLQNTTDMSMVCLQEQASVYKTQQSCPWCVYRNSPVSTKYNNHVHGVFTGTVRCLQNTTIMSMDRNSPVSTKHNNHVHGVFTGTVQCLQNTTDMSMCVYRNMSSVTKHNRHSPWCVYRNSPVSKHNRHVHGVFTGTVQCLQNTTIMSMVCLQEQASVYKTHRHVHVCLQEQWCLKTQQTCPWCVYRNSPVSTHNNHVHGVFTGTVQCLQNTTDMSMVCLQEQFVYKTQQDMSMVCLQEQSSVYKTQQTCPWCVYRNSPVSTKHNNHVHGVFTGTVQCLQNTTIMSMVCLQEQSGVYKTQQSCPWCVYRNSPVSTKHNNHVHGVFTGTVRCLQNTTDMSMVCLQEQSSVYKTQQTCPCVFTGTVQCLQNTTIMSMVCLQEQSSVYKTQQTCPWCVYRNSPVSTKHNRHVHGVFTGTVQCLQNTTDMSMVCLQEQSSVYKTQQSCPWCVYRNRPVSTKHNNHVHGVFTCLQNTTIMSMVCLQEQSGVYKTQQIMSMVCLQEQSGVYKTVQSCPWCVYRKNTKHNNHVHGVFTGTVQCPTKHTDMSMCVYRNMSSVTKHNNHVHGVYRNRPVSTKHNNHVHGVFTGTVQCLQNTTDMSMVCLQEQSSVYKIQQSCPWCVYRNSPVSTKHNMTMCVYRNSPVSLNTTIMSMVSTGTVQCLKTQQIMSMVCLQEQSSVYKTQQTCPCVFTGTVRCL